MGGLLLSGDRFIPEQINLVTTTQRLRNDYAETLIDEHLQINVLSHADCDGGKADIDWTCSEVRL